MAATTATTTIRVARAELVARQVMTEDPLPLDLPPYTKEESASGNETYSRDIDGSPPPPFVNDDNAHDAAMGAHCRANSAVGRRFE
ncbi:hypothetical protein HDU90_007721 [Geranomyces variabilis]|nr:hypothetical protein HDU90_007721 [Geranomyces variabilis]